MDHLTPAAVRLLTAAYGHDGPLQYLGIPAGQAADELHDHGLAVRREIGDAPAPDRHGLISLTPAGDALMHGD